MITQAHSFPTHGGVNALAESASQIEETQTMERLEREVTATPVPTLVALDELTPRLQDVVVDVQ